jgi:hypothetical protein
MGDPLWMTISSKGATVFDSAAIVKKYFMYFLWRPFILQLYRPHRKVTFSRIFFQIFAWRISRRASERRVTFSLLLEKPISPTRQIFPFRGPNPPAMSML